EAGAVFAGAAIFAMAARKVFLERDDIAFFHAPPFPRDIAELFDHADHLMAEDARTWLGREVHAPIAATDTRRLDPHQPRIGRDFGQGEFPHLGPFRVDHHRRAHIHGRHLATT